MRYPARYLFVFLEHHGMLSVFGSPTWRTVVGGSATYVEAIATRIDEVRAGTPVRSVRRVAGRRAVTADEAYRACSTPPSSRRIPTRRC